ncbi:30S ribosomal protein S20 [uncultured Intestinimonas sp.]|uniref:30S ribosomal protein S20 n=1 Tax=uncultured Intestinimonas sp. TaxID=1689265 RepID=UPI0025D6370A|nr:30S ribosomal protein S20 [uncultured Intestinimonas sp.]
MPNIKSAKKRVLVNETKAARNKAAKSVYKATVKAIDKAAAKGLLHRNNAANKKSAMTIKLNKLA